MQQVSHSLEMKLDRLFVQACNNWFNPLPNNKILDLSKLKAFADDRINVTQKLKFALGRVENIVGKGENACYQHLLLFPQCFQKLSFSGSLKSGLCGKGLKAFPCQKCHCKYCFVKGV